MDRSVPKCDFETRAEAIAFVKEFENKMIGDCKVYICVTEDDKFYPMFSDFEIPKDSINLFLAGCYCKD